MFEVLSFGLLMFFVLVVVFPLMICVMDYLSERKYESMRLSKEWVMRNHPAYKEKSNDY
jgi:type III secretory pathway component EscU